MLSHNCALDVSDIITEYRQMTEHCSVLLQYPDKSLDYTLVKNDPNVYKHTLKCAVVL